MIFFCVGVVYSGEYDVCDVTLSVQYMGELEKYARPRWESNLRPLEYQPNALPTELRGQDGSSNSGDMSEQNLVTSRPM